MWGAGLWAAEPTLSEREWREPRTGPDSTVTPPCRQSIGVVYAGPMFTRVDAAWIIGSLALAALGLWMAHAGSSWRCERKCVPHTPVLRSELMVCWCVTASGSVRLPDMGANYD